MNSTQIGLVIAIASVLLAIPLSILANILTAKVQSWWATTSRRRRIRRVAWLKDKIAFREFYNPLPPLIQLAALFIYSLGSWSGALCLWLLDNVVHAQNLDPPVRWLTPYVIVGSIIVGEITLVAAFWRAVAIYENVAPHELQKLKAELKRLEIHN